MEMRRDNYALYASWLASFAADLRPLATQAIRYSKFNF
jgi:hypothetical protein